MSHCQVLFLMYFSFLYSCIRSLHVKDHALVTLLSYQAFHVNPAHSVCFTSISLFLPLCFFTLECCLHPSLASRSVCLLSSLALPMYCKSISLGCNTLTMCCFNWTCSVNHFKDGSKDVGHVFLRGRWRGKTVSARRGKNNSVVDCGVVVPLGDALNPNLLLLPPSLPLDLLLKFLWKKQKLL